MKVTAFQTRITTPPDAILKQIEAAGWAPGKVDWDQQLGQYYAEASNPIHGHTIRKVGPDPATALAALLAAVGRHNVIRTAAQWKVGMWQHSWEDKMEPIAEAYANAPAYDPKVAPYWKELGDDSLRRLEVLRNYISIEPTLHPTPYTKAKDMHDDIFKRRKYQMSHSNLDHPVWSAEQSAAFRAVHDILGRAVSGGGFGWQGANAAFAAHAPLLSPTAQAALFTEAIARPAFRHTHHAPDIGKVAVLPEFIEGAQEEHNSPGHSGIHPSQTIIPHGLPTVYKESGWTPPTLNPGEQLADPNYGYQTGIDPLLENAKQHHGDPFQQQATMENARLIDTQWYNKSEAEMKQAIVNAFRVVLLSPRKDLRWNAVHYQDIAEVPAQVDDPKVYWDTLEAKRRAWNASQGIHPDAHMIWFKERKAFESVIWQLNPTMSFEEAKKKADSIFFDWMTEEQEEVEKEDAEKPVEKQRGMDEIERRANERLAKRLKSYVKDKTVKNLDVVKDEPEQISMFGAAVNPQQRNILAPELQGKYGAFMGTHLKSISQISQHVNEILQAALEDVHEHDAAGHHFRAKVLSLNVSGVGPKVCSFAWLLLQPMTSQLATIDTHMADVLGINFEKDLNPRDYFKFERQLQAGRDAAGYGSVPLGTFQWGMWDLKRTGEGSHQDHSAMKVLNPVPHTSIDWASKAQNLKAEDWHNQAPDWWQATKPARDQVGDEYDQTIAKNVPQNVVPYQVVPATVGRTAKTQMREIIEESGLTPMEVWALDADMNDADLAQTAEAPGAAPETPESPRDPQRAWAPTAAS
jgi:hypothetical protein